MTTLDDFQSDENTSFENFEIPEPAQQDASSYSFNKLKRECAKFESALKSMNQTFKYWISLEVEFETFKEELLSVERSCTREQIIEIVTKLKCTILDQQAVANIFSWNEPNPGELTRDEYVYRVDTRIKFIQEIIRKIANEICELQDKLRKLLIVLEPSRYDEQGRELVEIREELDENDNVISSSVSREADREKFLEGILAKSGLLDSPNVDLEKKRFKNADNVGEAINGKMEIQPNRSSARVVRFADECGDNLQLENSSPRGIGTTPTRAGLSMSSTSTSSSNTPQSILKKTSQVPLSTGNSNTCESWKGMFPNGARVLELDDNDNVIRATGPIIPKGETPGENTIRREMLDYLRESIEPNGKCKRVNETDNYDNVKAGKSDAFSIDSSDTDSDSWLEDDDDGDDDFMSDLASMPDEEAILNMEMPDDDDEIVGGLNSNDVEYNHENGSDNSESDSENEFGMSYRRQVSDEIHKEMAELERKLQGWLKANGLANSSQASPPK